MIPNHRLADLSASQFFAALNPATLNELQFELELVRLPGGEILFHAGAAGDSMYVVLSGRLRVSVERSDGSEEIIREIGRGESVGELALLTGEARSATIRAIRDSELAMLSRSAFERAIKSDPTLIRQLAVQLAARQRQGADAATAPSNVRTIAVLPLDSSQEAAAFAGLLEQALARLGPTLRVDQETINRMGGVNLANSTEAGAHELTERLDALEINQRTVVYQAAADLTPWTQRCVRQADLILLVGRAEAIPPNAALEQLQNYFASCAITARIELVLLHGREFDAGLPMAPWLAALRAAAHHHLVPSLAEDVARLARLVTGNAIGLVLSGGGARPTARRAGGSVWGRI